MLTVSHVLTKKIIKVKTRFFLNGGSTRILLIDFRHARCPEKDGRGKQKHSTKGLRKGFS